jgi:Ca-activated chloride channel homolog
MRARLLKTAALALSTCALGACGAAYGGAATSHMSASRAAPQPAYDAAPMAPPPGATVAMDPAKEAQGTEDYKDYGVNPVVDPHQDKYSTFSIDVDTAS